MKKEISSKNISMKFILEWIETSESNLDSSKLLYKNKKFPESIFFLQQSIEKLTKASGLFMGAIKEKDLSNEIGHDLIKIYEKNLRKFSAKNNSFLKAMKKHPELKEIKILNEIDRNELKDSLDDLSLALIEIRKNKNDIGKTSRNLGSYLSKIDKLFSNEAEALKEINNFRLTEKQFARSKKEMIRLFEDIEKVQKLKGKEYKETSNTEIEKLNKDFFEKIVKAYFPYVLTSLTIYMINLYLSIIILPHSVNRVRYPEGRGLDKIYNDRTPIVKNFNRIHEFQIKNLEKTKKFIINYEKMEKKKAKSKFS
ncbi:MAG: HEPN domain-containing protein [Nanoarchaeota archaeon]|nr:HEPN domain-containing protein [Nanoarchaeota archaeon]